MTDQVVTDTGERWWKSDQVAITICLICLVVSIAALTIGSIALSKSINTASAHAGDIAFQQATAKSQADLRNSQCSAWRFQAGAVTLPDGSPQPDPVTDLGWANRVYAKGQYDLLNCLPMIPKIVVPAPFNKGFQTKEVK